MTTISRWVVPCYFTEDNYKTDILTFDLTDHLKLILKNEVWNRKFQYGFSIGLKNTDPNDILNASIKIFPRFISGYVNENRVPELIELECGKLPSYLKVKGYKEWSHNIGFCVIEIEYKSDTKNIPTKDDVKQDFMFNVEKDFVEKYQRQIAVLKELGSFFLAGLHLTFPTQSYMMRFDSPLNDGFFQINSGKRVYATKLSTNAFMHEILLETSKRDYVDINLEGLASVWHYDLWPLKRYLNAVESDQISVDNLLDLIFALEGLFDKSASADFIKTMCIVSVCKTRREARDLKILLDVAYRIRNDIAHGERSYDPYDQVKLGKEETMAQTIYWKMKSIVATMLVKAISKLLKDKAMRNLHFSSDDLIQHIFEK